MRSLFSAPAAVASAALVPLGIASALLAFGGAAFAQGTAPAPIVQPGPPQVVTPGVPSSTVVVPGGSANGGPGANATIARSGSGDATVSTDSGTGGNAEQPSRAVPQTGGGGTGSSGGGGS